MKTGVKYCGHCRPFMDMTSIPELLRQSMPELEFGPVDESCRVALVLNACPAACASRPAFSGPLAVFACENGDDCGRLLRDIRAVLDAFV